MSIKNLEKGVYCIDHIDGVWYYGSMSVPTAHEIWDKLRDIGFQNTTLPIIVNRRRMTESLDILTEWRKQIEQEAVRRFVAKQQKIRDKATAILAAGKKD